MKKAKSVNKAKPTATHRIMVHEAEPERGEPRWTSTIYARNGFILWSSTRQRYSRAIDARKVARRFLDAAKAGRVEFLA